ncbi:MAG: hypothetical protein DSY42_06255 [Aquifex sp.]|nr:MAG: hypothetical protein DSY42_06255 [Aquifex sp.]
MFISFLLLALMLFSCSSKTDKCPPEWYVNYKVDNKKLCGAGYATVHIKGKSAQEALAIARAIEKIAAQKNVRVDSETLVEQIWTQNSAQSLGRKGIKLEIKDIGVSGVIKEAKWCGSDFYVLICEE